MFVALTGTPGVGKTTVAHALREMGCVVNDQNLLFSQMGLMKDLDEFAGSYIIDLEKVQDLDIKNEDLCVVEGHLSHNFDVDMIIVLRCRPSKIFQRLIDRGYLESKAKENALSEALDVILIESIERGLPTFEVDCTHRSPEELASSTMEIINGKCDGYLPGNVDWTEELIRWS